MTATCTTRRCGPGQVLCSGPERAAFCALLDDGIDRQLSGCSSNRRRRSAGGTTGSSRFPKNHGLRIDHILLSAPLVARCTASRIDRNARKGEKPSDHAPVLVGLDATDSKSDGEGRCVSSSGLSTPGP